MKLTAEIKFDCKYFIGERPCKPNKELGVFCHGCSYYERDKEIKAAFPEIEKPNPGPEAEGDKKIIIVKLDAVGDVLRTTSILPSLKEKYFDSSIIWITKQRSFPVLEDNELIDEIYFDNDDLEHIYSDEFDIAINLDSGSESCRIMSRLNARERFGYTLVNGKPYPLNELAMEWYLMGVDDNRKKANIKTYHRIIHEICGLNYADTKPQIQIPAEKQMRIAELKEKFERGKFDEIILINLGGGNRWQYKKWTKEGYAGLINMLSSKYRKSGIAIVAGDEDRDFFKEILVMTDMKDNLINLGCDNSTEDFICLVSLADKVFTSDSLCFHIAVALDKYTVVITGPTSHTELDVFSNGAILYSAKVDCLSCYLNTCDKTVTCMNTITPEEIMKLIEA